MSWFRKKEPEFERVVSHGTEARAFKFTGKFLAKQVQVHPQIPGTRVTRLYENRDGKYYVVYPNGNVSLPKTAEEVRKEHPDLAKRAGIERVIDLDKKRY